MLLKTRKTFELSLIVDDLSCNEALSLREDIIELLNSLKVNDERMKIEINDLEQSIIQQNE